MSALFRDVLRDFPFANEQSLSRAVAMMLTAIDPATSLSCDVMRPMFVVRSDAPGAGKSLLMKLALHAGYGGAPCRIPHGLDRQIDGLVLEADGLHVPLFLDDLGRHRRLLGGTLPGELRPVVECSERLVRPLGSTKEESYPNNVTVFVAGNDLRLTTGEARRAVQIDLAMPASGLPSIPGERIIGEHDLTQGKLPAELRGEAARIARAWLNAGCPCGSAVLPGFEEWSAEFGGMVEHAGFSPLASPLYGIAWRVVAQKGGGL